jgi:hypothetical protein
MDADDAWSAEIKRLLATPDPDPLALDEEDTAERLLAGDLPPGHAPPGYAEVAAFVGGHGGRAKPGRAGRPGGGAGRTAGGDPAP